MTIIEASAARRPCPLSAPGGGSSGSTTLLTDPTGVPYRGPEAWPPIPENRLIDAKSQDSRRRRAIRGSRRRGSHRHGYRV